MPATNMILRCSVCSENNYYSQKNRQNVTENLTLKKYSPRCRKHTEHRETRQRKKRARP